MTTTTSTESGRVVADKDLPRIAEYAVKKFLVRTAPTLP